MPPPNMTPQPMAPTMGAAPMQMAAAPDWRRQMMMANMLMGQGMGGPPVRHWAEGLGRLAQVVGGAYLAKKAHSGETAQLDELGKVLAERGMTLPDGMSLASLPEDVRNNLIANALDPAADEMVQVWDGQQMVWVPKSQAQGKPSTVPYAVDLQGDLMKAQAGRSNTNVYMPPGETKFQEGLGKLNAEAVDAARKAGQAAYDLLGSMKVLDTLLDAGARTGSLAGFERDVGALLTSFGIDPKGVGLQDPAALDMITKLTMDQTLSNVQKTVGSISNAEMGLFQAASAGIGQTPEGNRLLIGLARDVANRQIEYVTALNDWVANVGSPDSKGPNGKTFNQTWGEYAKANPVVTQGLVDQITKNAGYGGGQAPAVAPAVPAGVPATQSQGGGIPTITRDAAGQAIYDALPSGSVFTDAQTGERKFKP